MSINQKGHYRLSLENTYIVSCTIFVVIKYEVYLIIQSLNMVGWKLVKNEQAILWISLEFYTQV